MNITIIRIYILLYSLSAWLIVGFKNHLSICSRHRFSLNGINSPPNTEPKKTLRKENVFKEVEFVRAPSDHVTDLSEDPLLPFVETAVKASDKRKAQDISAYRISHLTEVASFMIIMEGRSAPQNQAISLSIEEDILNRFGKQPKKEGVATSGWILLDYGSVMIHIMTSQMRQFYKLERRWRGAEAVDISSWILPDQAESNQEEDMEPEEDPFWS